jgi:hypothetical protein
MQERRRPTLTNQGRGARAPTQADIKVSATWKQEERKQEKGFNAERVEETRREEKKIG